MKIVTILAGIFSMFFSKPQSTMAPQDHAKSKVSFYTLQAKTIEEQPFDLKSLIGKHVLIVNVASYCGYTNQYTDLEALYRQYQDRLVILAFPCDDFGGQEPGTNDEIKHFCESKFDITFTLMDKVSIKGDNMSPVYKWLTTPEQNGWNSAKPAWNFAKYLIDEKGELVGFYPSNVKPTSEEIVSKL